MRSRSDEAYAGALAVVLAVHVCASAGQVPPDLISVVAERLPDTRVRDRLLAIQTFIAEPEAASSRFGNSGYVVDAVPLALLVATSARGRPLESAVEKAVSLGGDTDTVASITGHAIGATGCELPFQYLSRVPGIADVEAVLDRFVAQVSKD